MCSAASFSSSTSSPSGRVPLIGRVTSRSPRRARKSSGDAETIAQPSPVSGRGCSGRSGASAVGERARVAGERRAQVLHEIHLVDVAARDRRAHRVDRRGVVGGCPGRLPLTGAEPTRVRVHTTRSSVAAASSGSAARLRRRRRVVAAQRLRQAVGEEDVATSQPAAAHVLLELLERARRLVQLEHRYPQTDCAAWRSQRTPSSRSSTGTRSSAEWMSRAAVSESIARDGKNP